MANIIMTISIVNTKLRDYSTSLEDILYDLDIDYDSFINELELNNYYYDKELNQIKQK